MASVTLEEAQAKLPELIAGLGPDEEVLLTKAGQPVAKLKREKAKAKPRQLGQQAGVVLHMPEDFNAPLDDFKDYS